MTAAGRPSNRSRGADDVGPSPAERAPQWHAMEGDAVVAALGGDVHRGLSEETAAERLRRDGPNVIARRGGRPIWLIAAAQFRSALVCVLLVAGAVALALGERVDAAVIFGVVLVNAAIGFVQEARAVRAIESLARSMRVTATVRRGGVRRAIDAAELVVGDLVLVEAGDRVPADLRLTHCHECAADESMLTGESVAVSKRVEPVAPATMLAERRGMAFGGSLVVRGAAAGVVVATADATEVGRVGALIASAELLATPLSRKIAAFSRTLLWAIICVAALAFGVGILRGTGAAAMFQAAVALAVAAIPEGLPAAVTIMLAVGVSRMAARRVIVRRLPAVEALGSTTVICSDKTGTLTRNEMTVVAIVAGGRRFAFVGSGYDPAGQIEREGAPVDASEERLLAEALRCGALCNDAALTRGEQGWTIHGDPTEGALLVAACKAGSDSSPAALIEGRPRIAALPFDSDRQYMATLHAASADELDRAATIYVKGALERVLAMSRSVALVVDASETGAEASPSERPWREAPLGGPDAQALVDAIHADAATLSGEGLRVLALARRRVPAGTVALDRGMAEEGLVFLGVVGMFDPPRPEATEAVAACRRAGISVKMITGDHALTALSIARRMGLETRADANPVTGAEMASIDDGSLPQLASSTAVFARMTPEQKLRLVRALQSRGEIVAMTGDGVNDAPALRQADIGIAMGRGGTEAAREASDIVLADDNFASIASAVEEGRAVFRNLTRFIVWTLPTNGGQAMVVLAAILFGWALPVLPAQVLWVNMSTAILLGMPLVFEPVEPDAMRRPPRDPARPILGFELFMRTGLVSLLLCVVAMILFHGELARGEREEVARTAAVSVIVAGQIFYLFSARALLRPAWALRLWSNPLLWAGVAGMLVAQGLFIYAPPMNRIFHSAPLEPGAVWRVMVAGAAVLAVVELEKAIRRAVSRAEPDSA
ncbi:MAG TPA: HAD-IC family P-type ATPase [Phycisphaerales bacterium]|nr:HAD-IC family P-type ATPase [Phycisphaerales bacterium]HMP37360.1 HAD-IC family P-type ATPase [Phycisphaerales bacterium]